MKHRKNIKPQQSKPRQQVTCPTCHRPFVPSVEGKSGRQQTFPFCSERCKLLDLGAWLDAEYRIPSRPDEESEDALYGGFDDPKAAF